MSENKIPTYNRKQRRQLAKALHLTNNQVNELVRPRIKDIQWTQFPEGTKVKLNYESIKEKIDENPEDWSEEYVAWIEAHKDVELTVYQDEDHKNTDIYCFKEDENLLPYTFHISDLEMIEMPGVTKFTI